jgi:cysteinyl-tRNA synthetase
MAPSLRLYNTLTRTKEEFRPLDPANVRMYVCGPTVYDDAHIGNARPIIVFDLLFRLLRHLYGPDHVTYVRNITDVDDKINARAAERGISIRDLTEETARRFHDDIAALGVLPPTIEPRATEHIDEMKALIERLVASGHAYVAEEHVLFHVPSMPDYGSLSKRPLDELEAGARVEVAPYKRSSLDFVLWKPSKPGDPAWPSPSGIKTPGRPGWHIECSAMSWKHLGEVFDIHAGGIDLVFPHHENEVAQSRCCFGTDVMARYWMHNGFLQVEGEKMAKSAGNFVTVRELLRDWPGEAIRLNMLKTHYRQPIDWTIARLVETKAELERWALAIINSEAETNAYLRAVRGETTFPSASMISALTDDLNTAEALAVLREHYSRASAGEEQAIDLLLRDCEFLGVLRHDKLWIFAEGVLSRDAAAPAQIQPIVVQIRTAVANNNVAQLEAARAHLNDLGLSADVASDGFVTIVPLSTSQKRLVHDMITARAAARAAKNWAESDRIRDELAAMGVVVKDNKDGTTTWEVAR